MDALFCFYSGSGSERAPVVCVVCVLVISMVTTWPSIFSILSFGTQKSECLTDEVYHTTASGIILVKTAAAAFAQDGSLSKYLVEVACLLGSGNGESTPLCCSQPVHSQSAFAVDMDVRLKSRALAFT